MILTGKSERARKALRLGLVDELVPRSILRRTAVAAAGATGCATDAAARRPRRTAGPASRPQADRPPAGVSRARRRRSWRRPAATIRRRSRALEAVRVGLEHGITAGSPRSTTPSASSRWATSPASWCRSSSPPTALKKDDGIRRGQRDPAPDPPARRGRRRLHGRRHRGDRGAQRRGGHPAQGRRPRPGGEGSRRRRATSSRSGSSAADHPAAVRAAERAALRQRRLRAGSAAPTW